MTFRAGRAAGLHRLVAEAWQAVSRLGGHGATACGRRALAVLSGEGVFNRVRWLIAPDAMAFGYALRTTLASLLALGIALWWELGSPQWAALTVWMIAQGTRGKSIAKARWHLFGMVVGGIAGVALVAACPQQPALFILLLAACVGGFCFVGTLLPGPPTMTNYRIHGMRASGFTCVIISLDGIAAPERIFDVAMARLTYITLGVVIETVVSSLFQYRLQDRARSRLADNFITAIGRTTGLLRRMLSGEEAALRSSADLLATLASMGDQVEFAEVELGGRRGHEGDHARAAMAAVTALFARGLDLQALLADPASYGEAWKRLSAQTCDFLEPLAERLHAADGFAAVMADLAALRAAIRIEAATCLEAEMKIVTSPPVDVGREVSITRQGQALHTLGQMCDELDYALTQFDLSRNPQPHDTFHYAMRTWRDWRVAGGNSLRASVSVFIAGMIWVATAWPDGLTFLMFVGIVSSLFSTLETPAMATRAFLHGALCVSVVAMVVAFYVVPAVTTYELLAASLVVPMMVGGLAFANPAMVLGAVAYNLFLTILVGPLNGGRLDEITFFNTAVPLVLAMAFCTWMYRVFLPLDPDGVRWDMRRRILGTLRRLASRRLPMARADLIGLTVERMLKLLNTSGGERGPVVDAYLGGVLSGMTVGMAIINLRAILARGMTPPDVQRALRQTLARMARFSGRYGGQYGRTARATDLAVALLVRKEQHEANLTQRVEILRALASLRVIAAELQSSRSFFDASSPYLDRVYR
ncbi:fusaric acid resistance protein FusB [Acetobacter nitrogenifigens DSM 23921 = NBRC 105050]|uniref:Fusaric acid resistance protein n=1 Tax=Acetobacter nitrogenifigens DSM 23921 = NBRC 105050 TaxID=1120919 RepID=A0A511X8Y0_9PROT|nr:FUSC family protein [Acetobacter nitrogenifigens]GBQ87254.1 fusaric acid resistance protein FusB [Acetobacter nitrogenifigens DSM 23921 = NBRC 105050]GEN59399.1 fusaric acid resistance protein [Acetobacter nitrogenifigens DSM 23921 = NBRC 105050]